MFTKTTTALLDALHITHTPPDVVPAADGCGPELIDAGVASVNSQLSELISTCSQSLNLRQQQKCATVSWRKAI
jgi:hypothetical protein